MVNVACHVLYFWYFSVTVVSARDYPGLVCEITYRASSAA